MDILTYTPEQQEFRERLRDFCANEIIPFVDQWEKDKIVPKEIWRKMGKAGFLCPELPKEYGGLGGDYRYSAIVAEELTRTWHSGMMAGLHSDIVVPYIFTYGSEETKKKYLPGCASGDIITAVAMTEPGAGSDLTSMTTTAVEDGDEIIINGSKTFISNGINSELVVLAARDPEVKEAHQAFSLYVVEEGTPGFKRGRHLEKMGMWSQDTAELFFTNCRIPKENMLGEKGRGFIMLMEKLQPERLMITVMSVFIAERIVEWMFEFCKNTKVSGKPLAASQTTKFKLVEMAAEVKIGRTFIEKLIVDHMEKQNLIVETSMGKFWTTDMLKRTTETSLDLMGNWGMLEKFPIARAFRDARITTIFAGTNEIMKSICAKFMGL